MVQCRDSDDAHDDSLDWHLARPLVERVVAVVAVEADRAGLRWGLLEVVEEAAAMDNFRLMEVVEARSLKYSMAVVVVVHIYLNYSSLLP